MSLADLEAIKAKLLADIQARQDLTVESATHGNRSAKFRSLEELQKALDDINSKIEILSGEFSPRTYAYRPRCV